MAERIIQTDTLQGIANALRGGTSQSAADKIEVADFAKVAFMLKNAYDSFIGFMNKNATDIIIPKGVTLIGDAAFRNFTSLVGVTLPSTLTSIGTSAFDGCSNLIGIILPSNVNTIGNNAFRSCSSLTNISIPEGVTIINASTFSDCTRLEEVNLPSTLTSIASNAFNRINANAIINCGFTEGAVSGAPWGAPETVTINYDVTPQA